MKVYHIEEIQERLKRVSYFSYHSGRLSAEFEFLTYWDGVEFLTKLARIAESLDHHPDLHLGYRKVKVEIFTHSVNGITDLDFQFIEQLEKIKTP